MGSRVYEGLRARVQLAQLNPVHTSAIKDFGLKSAVKLLVKVYLGSLGSPLLHTLVVASMLRGTSGR